MTAQVVKHFKAVGDPIMGRRANVGPSSPWFGDYDGCGTRWVGRWNGDPAKIVCISCGRPMEEERERFTKGDVPTVLLIDDDATRSSDV